MHHDLKKYWKVWRTLLVRGAGFPAKLVLDLACAELLERADGVLALSNDVQAARDHALAAVRTEYDARRDKALVKVIKGLEAGRVVEPTGIAGLGADIAAALTAHNAIVAARNDALAALKIAVEADDLRIGEILRRHAGSPQLREAVTWQNPMLIERCFDQLTRAPAQPANSKTRQYQRTVASYLQRYATKNDTIGFFGPVGWGSISNEGPTSIQPGPSLVTHRKVYFEHWAIDTLATHVAPSLRAYLAPRMNPGMRIEGTTLHLPIDRTTELPLPFARAALATTGERCAHEIVAELAADAELELTTDEAYEVLDDLVANGIITWTLEIPTGLDNPEVILRTLLEQIDDPDVAPALEALGELENLRGDVARSAGDPDALGRSIAALREAFTRITETDAERRAGQAYAGRTVLFEECRRDIEIEFSPQFFEPFAPTLALLLQSCRWYTHTIATRTREVLVAAYRELVEETGSHEVGYIRFFDKVGEHLSVGEHAPPIVAAAMAELQGKWATILGLDGDVRDTRAIELRSVDLADRVASEFAAPRAGWPSATYHSPDIMIIADGPDAVRAGRVSLVLGELHVAVNTISPKMARQHPQPDSIVATRLEDIPAGQLAAVIGKSSWNDAVSYSNRPGDLDIELGATRSPRARADVIAAADLVIDEIDGHVRARTRDGARTFELEELFDFNLTAITTSTFKLSPPRNHGPRVTIDGVVVMREYWRFETSELPFIAHMEPVDRLLAVRQFALQHRLPRFLFYKCPTEPKPVYLDLASPIYVDHFAHLARKAPYVVLSEMKPDLDELWLPDATGELYTSELRIVAVDPVPWKR